MLSKATKLAHAKLNHYLFVSTIMAAWAPLHLQVGGGGPGAPRGTSGRGRGARVRG